MYASCRNCLHRAASECKLACAPKPGGLLCGRYAMSDAFREKVLAIARKDLVARAMLEFAETRAEWDKTFGS